jgi:LacI family transcriptional regulator
MAKKRIRIKDIALASGVSTGTVDRVIHKRGNVNPQVKKRVEEVMKELNYQPNIIAQTLANNKVFRIGTLIPNFERERYWELPILGIQEAQKSNGHFPIEIQHYFYDVHRVQTFELQAKKLLDNLPDALIMAPIFAKEANAFLEVFIQHKIPYILINNNLKREGQLCYIGQDSYQCGVLGARLLYKEHKQNPTYILLHLEEEENIENAPHIGQKEAGFYSFFEKVKGNHQIIKKVYSDVKNKMKLEEFLFQIAAEYPEPDGIFLSTSKAYQLIEILGDQLPKTALVSFDLLSQNIEYLKAGKINYLINQNPKKQGSLALSNLLDFLLLKKEVAPIQYLPLDIVIKENVDYYL